MISNKSRLKRKLKVSTVDIQIKRSELRVSHSKVFSSDVLVYIFVGVSDLHSWIDRGQTTSQGSWIGISPKGFWITGSVFPWITGSIYPWIKGSIYPWIKGSIYPWIKGFIYPFISRYPRFTKSTRRYSGSRGLQFQD